MKFCRYCGIQEPDDNAIYCEHCGKAFSNANTEITDTEKKNEVTASFLEWFEASLNKPEYDN